MITKYTQKDIDRFWKKIDKNKSNIFYKRTRCWEFLSLDVKGYGQISIGHKILKAHRISYELHFGEFQNNLFVCHHCDNSACCNPIHLFLGTNKDNMNDRDKKGRQVTVPKYGENNNMHKLSDKQVFDIRKRFQRWTRGKDNGKNLAKEFGVSKDQISNIVNYKQRKETSL